MLLTLPAERVWGELQAAMTAPRPELFVEVMHACGALQVLLPEVAALHGVPQPAKHHPEIDTLVHVCMALQQAVKLTSDPVVRFAVLMHDLGKGVTPAAVLPQHLDHESAGLPLVDAVCVRLKCPTEYRQAALDACELHTKVHRAMELRAGSIVDLLTTLGVRHSRKRLERLLLVAEADARGRLGFEDRDYPQPALLQQCADAYCQPRVPVGMTGPATKQWLRDAQCRAVAAVLQTKE